MMPHSGSENTLRVLHTEWSLGWGGQEIRILAEMCAFRERGVGMALACRPGSSLGLRAREKGFVVYEFPFASRFDLKTILGLGQLIKQEKFSLLHSHSSVDGWCAGIAGRLFRLPVVRSRHLSSSVPAGLNARIVYDWLADAVIASGRHIRDQLIKASGGNPDKFFSIPAGADHRRFSPDVDASTVRKEFALDGRFPVIGIVAVLRSWKGHRILFEACARIKENFPGLCVFVVGDGPLRDHLPQWAAELGLADHVIFAGHLEDVPACMKAMDVCVLPSLKNEATSQVLPQAMLVGTPVICSSAGGLTEVVENRVTGLVVPPGDGMALAQALQECLRDPDATRQRAQRARRHALQQLTFDKQVADTLAVYRWVGKMNMTA